MRRLLESLKRALITNGLANFDAELRETMRVDTHIRDLPEGKKKIEGLETASRDSNPDDTGFLMDFLTAKLNSPLGSGHFFERL
jgi:hypothetical protein